MQTERCLSDYWRHDRSDDRVLELVSVLQGADNLIGLMGSDLRVTWSGQEVSYTDFQRRIVALDYAPVKGERTPFPGSRVDEVIGYAAHEGGHCLWSEPGKDKAIEGEISRRWASLPQALKRAWTSDKQATMRELCRIQNILEDAYVDYHVAERWEVLGEHVRIARRKLAERRGMRWELRQEIKSGESLTNRPVMKRILEEIETGVIGAIICQDFTRLSRDQDGIDGRVIRQICRDNECLIITPDKTYDFSLDVDDDLADIGFLIGKIQKRQNLKALARGMMEKARQGKMLYVLPALGYTWTETNPVTGQKAAGAEPKVKPGDVPLVQLIFDRYEQMSARRVALSLNEEGHRFPALRHQPHPFRAADVLRIITNPAYTGMIAWGREVRSRYLKGFQPVEHHVSELQIISFEQFNRVQEIARRRHWAPPRSVGSPFLFSGLLKCSRCGSSMVGQRQHKQRAGEVFEWHYYQCRAYHQYGRTACSGQCISEQVARSALEPFLADTLGQQLNLRGYMEDAAKELAGDADRAGSLRAEIQEAEAAMKRLADAVASGALDIEAARGKTLELREKRERAEKRLAAFSSGVAVGEELQRALALVESDLAGVLAGMERDRLGELLRLVSRRFSVEAYGGPRNRQGRVTAYEFTPEFQEFWLTHSQRMVELCGFELLGYSTIIQQSRSEVPRCPLGFQSLQI